MRYEQLLTLKNGKPCLLRSAGAADGPEVLEVFRLTHGETDYLLSQPEEISFTPEQEAEFLAKKEADPRELELEVITENAAALALYESVGFTALGRNPRGMRARDGHWQETALMALAL